MRRRVKGLARNQRSPEAVNDSIPAVMNQILLIAKVISVILRDVDKIANHRVKKIAVLWSVKIVAVQRVKKVTVFHETTSAPPAILHVAAKISTHANVASVKKVEVI